MHIVSFARSGYEGEVVKVEADLRRGIPGVDIVGLPDGAVREARERMRAAIRNSGFDFPRERILLNLTPAGLRKEGSSFDLPIALAVLLASTDGGGGSDGFDDGSAVMVLGELELSGRVRSVRGVLAAVSRGLESGVSRFLVPADNAEEARLCTGARVSGVETLAQAMHALQAGSGNARPENGEQRPGSAEWRSWHADAPSGHGDTPSGHADARSGSVAPSGMPPISWSCEAGGFEGVKGQDTLVRALQIAAAGGHNMLVYGQPGCGKTLSLRRFPSLLPDLDEKTAVTVTRIYSIAGLKRNGEENALIRRPPFREPHQGASVEGMTGGGVRHLPGEVSLAHGGVLFLDEAAQFKSTVLQALRGPLETGEVTLSRAGKTSTYPASFQLLMAINPCPCGNSGARDKSCTCLPEAVERYWKRLSAPLLDRVDLRIAVERPKAEELSESRCWSTGDLREGIASARRAQGTRGTLNAKLGADTIREACPLSGEAVGLFNRAANAERLSGRGSHAVLRIARTIADMENAVHIGPEHILEAFALRRWGAGVPDFLR